MKNYIISESQVQHTASVWNDNIQYWHSDIRNNRPEVSFDGKDGRASGSVSNHKVRLVLTLFEIVHHPAVGVYIVIVVPRVCRLCRVEIAVRGEVSVCSCEDSGIYVLVELPCHTYGVVAPLVLGGDVLHIVEELALVGTAIDHLHLPLVRCYLYPLQAEVAVVWCDDLLNVRRGDLLCLQAATECRQYLVG